MNASRFRPIGPRLLAGFGTAALLAGIGLAASRPVYSAGGPIAVSVANAPLPITTADDHDKQGMQYDTFIPISADGGSSHFSYTVPAGKRLVLESISASPNNFADNDHYSVLCLTRGGLGNQSGSSSFSVLPDGSPFPTGSIHPHQYADNVSVAGYLVDVP